MSKRPTAGELYLKASQDTTAYDSLEVGHALTEDIIKQLEECIKVHNELFNEDEYCIVMQLASDPLLKGCMRRKFYGWLYLPKPRPNQTVFLYSKKQHKILKRLWVLPHVLAMETLYETAGVTEKYKTMKQWSQAFYDGTFWPFIRKQHNISMLSQDEYLDVNREVLIKSGSQHFQSAGSQPFDFSKITTNQVVDPQVPIFN